MDFLIEETYCEFFPHIAESDEFCKLEENSIDFVKVQKPFHFSKVPEDTKVVYLWFLMNFKKSFNSQQFFYMEEDDLNCENVEEIKKSFTSHVRKELWCLNSTEISLNKYLRFVWHGDYLVENLERYI